MWLCLLLFALGRYPGRLWPYFGLSALSRQLHRQELMAELSALCWGGVLSLPITSLHGSLWHGGFCHVSLFVLVLCILVSLLGVWSMSFSLGFG